MRRITAIVLALGAMTAFSLPVYANAPPAPGQPGQSCQSFFGPNGPFTPNGFNTAGFTHATTVYAGSHPLQTTNPKSVSQYDVACYQASLH
jgi:hypothetical protein